MQVFADLQLHSKYAMATSRDMDLEHLADGARTKGLNLLGTGDFTHPKWFSELRSKLSPVDGTGLFSYSGMTWMLSGEVSTIYEQGGKVRKVHHLLYAPDMETVAQANEFLSKFGDLSSDGRPILTGVDSPGLVEGLSAVSPSLFVVPAHAWTPWFSVFGSRSGFDSLKDCYGDQTSKIFAIETGLSSDPSMNWRISSLDGVALISNSDAHSPNPWRLGREANAFELPAMTYRGVFDAIRTNDPSRFLYTIEVDPSYGKYHFTGHKKCGVSFAPSEAARLGNSCPKCGKKMTVGVLQRVEALADRPDGFTPEKAIPFKRLLPLYEVISFSTGVNRLYAKSVLDLQERLLRTFGNEFAVLLRTSEEDIARVVPTKVARAIIASRAGRLRVTPGYDGVYGVPELAG
ncbi:MAG: DNA helicase UvrD [Thaumarchaeota archaeon]|nr:DNA helicase UvrD [Nitrososphaerota archaeon]